MSLRTLKKLRGEISDLQLQKSVDGQSVSESEDGSDRAPQAVVGSKKKKKKQLIANPFSLLEGTGNSPSDTEAKEDDDKDGTSTNSHNKDPLQDADATKLIEETKHKNKKKRKSKLNKQRSSEVVLEEDEIDASIREVNQLLGVDINVKPSDSGLMQDHSQTANPKNLLVISHKHLNPNNEMKKIFGSRVVHADQSKKRGRHRSHSKATWLVAHRSTWPHIEKLGLSMSIDDSKDNSQVFKFEHSKQYQNIQFQFLDAVESYNPENIAALIRMTPYHVDSLIQLSDACRIGEDIQMAAELIERAIYSLESSFHPLFNITQGTCRLNYARPENRSFFIALYKHIYYIGQKGCYRTALEFSKLLLSLDPDGDPLSVLLFIDFYAVKSAQYDFIIRLFSEWETARNLSKLPNFAFSVPLAKFHLSKEQGMESNLSEADEMLQNSFMMFPSLLLPLLDKCSVEPDPEVRKHEFFGINAKDSDPPALKLLISMYINQCFPLWKEMDVLEWLERNIRSTLQRIDREQENILDYRTKRLALYRPKLPLNICRHVILSEVKETMDALPQEVMKSPGASFDPVPPPDSITSYVRPSREPRPATGSQNVLSMFFRTMMPNFTAEQYQNRREEALLAMLENQEVAQAENNAPGAAAAEPGAGNDLRRSVTSLLDAMRDLLSNIHLPEIPRDGDGDDEESDDDR